MACGHVFCSFLALALQKELSDLCTEKGVEVEWADALRDLDRLQEASIENGGKTWLVRTDAAGSVNALFKAVGIALPPRVQSLEPQPAAPAIKAPARRGRPRRSATTH